MYEFKYHRPATVRQAANLLVKNEDAKLIAGGHTLIPVMKQRLASPPHLVDLSHIEGLDGIEMKGRSLVIGATARHADVAGSPIVGEAIPALAELAGLIGDPAVRHKGTIGGSLANNDPTADYPAACLALGATIVTNKRRLKPEEFFQGLFTTALESDEIITRVMFPLPKKAAYIKFRNQASRYALVGVFVAKRPSDVRVAVTGAGSDGVFRVTSFEEALKKRFNSKVLDGLSVPADGLNSDLHGSAEYRAHLISVLARRAVDAANGKAELRCYAVQIGSHECIGAARFRRCDARHADLAWLSRRTLAGDGGVSVAAHGPAAVSGRRGRRRQDRDRKSAVGRIGAQADPAAVL